MPNGNIDPTLSNISEIIELINLDNADRSSIDPERDRVTNKPFNRIICFAAFNQQVPNRAGIGYRE